MSEQIPGCNDPFAVVPLPSGQYSNSEHEDDGTFRRFVTTAGGVEFLLDQSFTPDQIEKTCRLVDSIATANVAHGKRVAQQELRAALGIKD